MQRWLWTLGRDISASFTCGFGREETWTGMGGALVRLLRRIDATSSTN